MERDNYFIMLGLEFDPATDDEKKIMETLKKKRQEWTRMQDNPSKRAAALKYLNMVGDIEKVMLNNGLRKNEAQEAKILKTKALDNLNASIRVTEGKGYVTKKEVDDFLNKYSVYGIDRRYIEKTIRKPISDNPPLQMKTTTEIKVIDRLFAKNISRHLKSLGKKDIYDFIGLPTYSSFERLQEAAEKKRRETGRNVVKTATSNAEQELSGFCVKIFSKKENKQEYDNYLLIGRFSDVNDMIEEERIKNRVITPFMLIRLINFAMEKHRLKLLEAEEYITNYCNAYGITIESGEAVKKNSCASCSFENDIDANICSSCGMPLKLQCPKCGTENENNAVICKKCAFDISNMKEALPYVSAAKILVLQKDWQEANKKLLEAKKFWPNHNDYGEIEQSINLCKNEYYQFIKIIEGYINQNFYYSAMEVINSAINEHVKIPEELHQKVSDAVLSTETALVKARSLSGEPALEILINAAKMVSDSRELTNLLTRFPPEPPSEYKIQIYRNAVEIKWMESISKGNIVYHIVRKEGSKPNNPEDGEIVYAGGANNFIDGGILQFKVYYYCLYSSREGILSVSPMEIGPVVSLPEVDNIRVFTGNGTISIEWNYNPNFSEILIWRKQGEERPSAKGDGLRIFNERLDGLADSGLNNDTVYWYYIAACFISGEKKFYSKGVIVNAIPHIPAKAITDLTIDKSGDEYTARWNYESANTVLFLYSNKKPFHKVGEERLVSDLLSIYKKLETTVQNETRAKFNLSLNGEAYIIPVVVSSQYGTLGRPCYIASISNPDKVTYDIFGDELYINMKWAPGVQKIVVCHRFDQFPASPYDTGANIITCTKSQYDFDAAVLIHKPEQKVYYTVIYSAFDMPNGKTLYSGGVTLIIDNEPQKRIYYNARYIKPVFSEEPHVLLQIKSEADAVLPPIVFVAKRGGFPLSKFDGDAIFAKAKSVKINGGEITYKIPYKQSFEDAYIRMFLQEDDLYHKYRLLSESDAILNI